ncbi:mariner Mos1 transposase [Trichonephila clavipes]|nr:mariner Mos1 transposase [Trichonephila clavipes]
MLIAFFDSKGLVHKEILLERTTLNDGAYSEVLKRLQQRICSVRPEWAKQGSWTLLHDNAWQHTALVVWQSLVANGVVTLDHPPLSLIHLI